MMLVRQFVRHSGLARTGEVLALLRYDPKGCREHAPAVRKVLRLARVGVPALLDRARRVDLALHSWDHAEIPEAMLSARVEAEYEAGPWPPCSRRTRHIEAQLVIELMRHTPSHLTVRRVRRLDDPCWDCSREGLLLHLTLLDFMENLHLEARRRRDHALIVRLMRKRLAWAARIVGNAR